MLTKLTLLTFEKTTFTDNNVQGKEKVVARYDVRLLSQNVVAPVTRNVVREVKPSSDN